MTCRRLVSVLVVVAALVAAPARASADDKQCLLNPDTGKLVCSLVASPSPPFAVRLSEELPIEWRRVPWQDDDGVSQDRGCVRTVADIREVGVLWVVSLHNTVTGEVLDIDETCEWPGENPPVPPPPPPTPAQLAEDNAQTLTLHAVLSPASDIGGLTGLDSWLWCEDPGAVAADAALNGWVAQGSVEVVQIGWEVNGPTGTVANTTTCGSADAPAVTWMPETIGEYSVVVTAVWAGTWDLTYNGVPMGTYPLGPLALAASAQPYPVDEYRGELTG